MSGIGITREADIRAALNPDARPSICDCPYEPNAERQQAIAWHRGVNHSRLAVKDCILAARRQARSMEAVGGIDRLAKLIEEALELR